MKSFFTISRILKIALVCIVLFSAVIPVYAQVTGEYVPLAIPVSNSNDPNGLSIRTNNITVFFIDAFRITIAAAAALAIIMIIIGGIQYMSTDALSGKHDGRKKVQDALVGLLLVAVTFLILQTINPSIVSLGFLSTFDSNKNPPSQPPPANTITTNPYNNGVGDQLVSVKSCDNKGICKTIIALKDEPVESIDFSNPFSISLQSPFIDKMYKNTMAECTTSSSQGVTAGTIAVISPCKQESVTEGDSLYYPVIDGEYSTSAFPTLEGCTNYLVGRPEQDLRCEEQRGADSFTRITYTYSSKKLSTIKDLTPKACTYVKNTSTSAGKEVAKDCAKQ